MSLARRVRGLSLTWADGVFAGLAIGSAAIYLVLLRGYEFRGDDWRLFDRGGTAGDLLEPYNGHLSAVPIVVYKTLARTVGLGSTVPLRAVAALATVALATSLYLLVRSRTAPALALVAGGMALWFHGFQTTPSAFNHWLALTGIVGAFALLDRPGRRALVALVVVLVFALSSSGVGIAGAVGLLGYAVLTRKDAARIAAVVVPVVAWVVWYVTFSLSSDSGEDPSVGDVMGFVWDGVVATFRGIGLGNRFLGWVLLLAFVVLAVRRSTQGIQVAAGHLSWAAALVFWWVGLTQSRFTKGAGVTRYQLIAAVFALLAVLPVRRPASFARWRDDTAVLAGSALAALGLVAVVFAANHTRTFDQAEGLADGAPAIRQASIVAGLGSDVVRDPIPMPFEAKANISAGTYRRLTESYGVPRGARTSHPDRAVVRLGDIRVHRGRARPGADCVAVGSGWRVPGDSRTVLRGGSGSVPVSVRRFEREWVPVGSIRADATATLELPALGAGQPWQVRAPGACRVRLQPDATIVAPTPGRRLSGTVGLAATATDDVVLDAARFELHRPGVRRVLGDARLTYGWLLEWDSATVPDGRWELVAVTTESGGATDRSHPVPVVVDNG